MNSIRSTAARAVHRVVTSRTPLDLDRESVPGKDRALLQEIVMGTLRNYQGICAVIRGLTASSKSRLDPLLEALLASGLYQLLYTGIPAYATVSETVNAARELHLGRASGLVNAVMRRAAAPDFRKEDMLKKEEEIYSCPPWLLRRLKTDHPERWQDILKASNSRPPMWIRVDLTRITRDEYTAKLDESGIAVADTAGDAGIKLAVTCPASRLPGIREGLCYVQDASAQAAAVYLDPQPGERILDACAAPGGKTTHILEITGGKALVDALDISSGRLLRLQENLKSRGLTIRVMEGDAADPAPWWDREPYDRILLDAPCSGTGVLRRHPDIKHIRTEKDIAKLAAGQQAMLEGLWTLLRPGGTLLYSTCSVLRQEDQDQIDAFLERHRDEACHLPLPESVHITGDGDRDGFFYAALARKPLKA